MQTAQSRARKGFLTSFTAHPADVGETYAQHFLFACRFGSRLMGAGAAALIHALIPALFETTASRMIREMHDEITRRAGHQAAD